MSSRADHAKTSIRDRHHPLSWMNEQERAETVALRFTQAQQRAIANDTRLPGEIACTYGTSAAVILALQQMFRRRKE